MSSKNRPVCTETAARKLQARVFHVKDLNEGWRQLSFLQCELDSLKSLIEINVRSGAEGDRIDYPAELNSILGGKGHLLRCEISTTFHRLPLTRPEPSPAQFRL